MPHTRDTIYADMLSLLKRVEFKGYTGDSWEVNTDMCPVCGWCEEHLPGCHLQSTIALAEEMVCIVWVDT